MDTMDNINLLKNHFKKSIQYELSINPDAYGVDSTNYMEVSNILDQCTINQLFKLYDLLAKNQKFILLGIGEYLAINLHNCYYGIERDGYTHS